MTQEQVIEECRQELAQNFGCSEDEICEILAKHGARLGLTGEDTAYDMLRLMCDWDEFLRQEKAEAERPILRREAQRPKNRPAYVAK